MKEYMQKLSDEQFKAVVHQGNVLVTAIPGSGKTRTLINRIIYKYIEEDKHIIIAITYTRRAGDEIEERIMGQLGVIPNNIWIGTIHKFCLEFIVRGYGSYSKFFSRNFQIISEADTGKLINELRDKYKIKPFTEIDFSLDTFGNPNEKDNTPLVQEYFDTIIAMNKIDFNYILYESYRLLVENPIIALQLSILIKDICIDEYQDTQDLQYQILSLIAVHDKSIDMFIVGDSNQSIYEGIGGVVKTKKELDILFGKEFTELHLIGCYRSNQMIIDFYKEFAIDKYEMKSLTNEWENPEISIITNNSKKEVFNQIYEIVKKIIKDGYNENEIAIVAPQWYQLYEISTEMKKRMPDTKFDAPNLVPLKKDEDGIINKICRILLTNFDYYNLNRLKRKAYEILRQFDEEYGHVLNLSVMEFLNLIKKSQTKDSIGTEYLHNTLANLFDYLSLFELFKDEIDDFILGTKERIDRYQDIGLEDDKIYFEQSLRSKSGIVISTIHGIKGEEYAVVIAFALLEGYIPYWNDLFRNDKSIARVRSNKLLFVLCSRAKEKLYLFAENDRKTNSGNLYKPNLDLQRVNKNNT